jgi:hypothetical protein
MSSDNDDLRPLSYNIDDLHHQGTAIPVIFNVLSLLRHNRISTLQNFFKKVDSDAGDILHLALDTHDLCYFCSHAVIFTIFRPILLIFVDLYC